MFVKLGIIDLELDFSLAKIVQFLHRLLPSSCPYSSIVHVKHMWLVLTNIG